MKLLTNSSEAEIFTKDLNMLPQMHRISNIGLIHATSPSMRLLYVLNSLSLRKWYAHKTYSKFYIKIKLTQTFIFNTFTC